MDSGLKIDTESYARPRETPLHELLQNALVDANMSAEFRTDDDRISVTIPFNTYLSLMRTASRAVGRMEIEALLGNG